MKLLTETNLGKEVELGKKVGIVGGGNAAVDAARVAIRNQKTEEVSILYRRTKKEMQAYEEEVESAIEEGVDIKFLVLPTKVLSKEGKVTGIECVRMKMGELDESGRRKPLIIPGSEFTLELDTLIAAIGESSDLSFFSEKDGIEISKWSTIMADEETLSTSRTGVFAGGDVVKGPSTVIEAIAAGKKAAESISKYLDGKSMEPEYKLSRPSLYIQPVELTEEEIENDKRPEMPRLSAEKRWKNFSEVELGLEEEMAIKEARRCLRCELETKEGKKALGREK